MTRRILISGALCAAYYLSGRLGLSLAVVDPSVSAVWPPSALGMAVLILLGAEHWPGIFFGAFLVNLQVAASSHGAGWETWTAAAVIATGNSLEAVLGAWAAERFAAGRRSFERAGTALKFFAVSGLAAPVISATIGTTTLVAAGWLSGKSVGLAWLTWWLGDAAAIIVAVPPFLLWLTPPEHRYRGGGAIEAGAFLAAIAALLFVVFGSRSLPIGYLLLPLLVYGAFRFGPRGSATTVFLVACAAIAGTWRGLGPYAMMGQWMALPVLQGFLGTIGISTAVMAAVVSDHQRAIDELAGARERLEAEVDRRTRELVQVQKMEAIGRLAGGVAHEFNNILTGIAGLAELIRTQSGANPQGVEDANRIGAACRRGSVLVGSLLSFGRRRGRRKKSADLNAAILGCRKMLEVALGSGIEIRTNLEPALAPVLAVSDQIDQILLNLCLNARDAMPGGGTLEISTRAETVDARAILSHGVIESGAYAILSVVDDGAGVPEDIRPMIFEPFFTTKGEGRGTGLGLSVVYGIIVDHGGAIDLLSRPGRTEFRIYLPVSDGKPEATPFPEALPPARGGQELLLLADDDPLIRELLVRALEPLGYRLLVAEDGDAAVRLAADSDEEISLCVLDLVMPKLRGDAVYECLARLNPRLKVLFMSGYAQARVEAVISEKKLPLLPKPFTLEEAATKVRELLDARGNGVSASA